MAHRNKNMLEAFKASAAAEKAPQPPPRAGGAAPGGPFASAPVSPAAPAAPRAPRELAWRPTQVQRLVVLQVLLLVAVFWLGRATAPSVEASNRSQPTPEGNAQAPGAAQIQMPAPQPAVPQAPNSPLAAAEAALLDPANVYTVTVAQYRATRDEALAIQTRDYLLALGIPACVTVLDRNLFVVAGAAPDKSPELRALRDRIRTINGPPPLNKKAEFFDAYESKIERVFPRKKP